MTVFRSAMRDVFVQYIEIERQAALEGFRHVQGLFVQGRLKEAPQAPELLRGDD